VSDFRILHVSDLHFSKGADREIVLNSFFRSLDEICSAQGKFDLVIFSGDLVQAGGTNKQFEDARSAFIDVVIKSAGVEPTMFVLCPGNHDVNRDVVRRDAYIQQGLGQTLTDRNSINSFLDTELRRSFPGDISPALERLREYFAEQSRFAADVALLTPFCPGEKGGGSRTEGWNRLLQHCLACNR
jgi:predicted MPP superfamily phosphohydrolase